MNHVYADAFGPGRMLLEFLTGTAAWGRFELWTGPLLGFLLNSLWLGTLSLVPIAGLFYVAKRRNAATRYALWLSTLVAIVILPLVAGRLALVEWSNVGSIWPAGTVAAETTQSTVISPRESRPLPRSAVRSEPSPTTVSPAYSPSREADRARASRNRTTQSAALVPAAGPLRSEPLWRIQTSRGSILIVLLWITIAALNIGRLGVTLVDLQRLKRRSRRVSGELQAQFQCWRQSFGIRRSVQLCLSEEITVPAVLGLIGTRVVLPAATLHRLTPAELEQICLHELAHVQRWDDWTCLLQRLIAAILFFNPAAIWICRQLNLEREIACDDWVIRFGAKPKKYALCLTKLIEFAISPPRALPAPGAFLSRKQIFRRVEMILKRDPNANPRLSKPGALLGVALLVALMTLAGLASPVIAVDNSRRAPSPPAVPAVPAVPGVPSAPAVSAVPAPAATPAVPGAPAVPSPAATPSVPGTPSVPAAPAVPAVPAVPSVPVQFADIGIGAFDGSISIHRDDGETTVMWSEGSHQLQVSMDGEVEFTDDDRGIQSVSANGFFLIQERYRSEARELEVVPGRNGELEYYYSERRRPKEFDDDAREWLARVLPEVIRRTGIGAEKRVQRIRAEGGPDAVLREISRIESDYVKRLYFEELVASGDLDAVTVRKMLRQMGREVDSDYEKAEMLISMSDYTSSDPEARTAYIEAVAGIDSDYEVRRVLSALGTRRNVDAEYTLAVLELAANMDSDYEKSELLIELADYSRGEARLRDLYVDVVSEIDSDYEKRRVLSELLPADDSDEHFVAEVFAIAQTISSDYERAELLIEMAGACEGNDGLLQSYLSAVEGIDSDYEKRRVISALALDRDVSDNSLRDLLRIADGIDSDYEKAEFLLEYGELYMRTDALQNDLSALVETIDSDYERDRVSAALWRFDRRQRGTRRP